MKSHHSWFKRGILLWGLLLVSSISLSQDKVEEIDKLVGKYAEYGKFNGSVLVADQGQVIYKKGFGMANMEWDIPNQSNTKHRIGSITKQFTAMLILQLAADGKLDLQAPITTYLPDYPKTTGGKITTHHLLTHTSGIPNYTAFPGFMKNDTRDPYEPEAFVEKFANKDLDFEPGARFSYSNSGYFLLGVIVEKLTGKTYEDLLQEKIFTPLNMQDTGYDHHGDIIKNRATGYEKRGNTYVNSRYLDMSIPYAAGSMYSTVEDLYLWDQALYTNKLLPQEFMDLYFKPYIKAFGNNHYAYGWGVGYDRIGTSKDSIYVIQHGGGINGFNTIISRATSDKSLVVLFSNTGGAPLNQMTRSIRGILNDKDYNMPKKSVATEVLEVIRSKGIDAGIARYHDIKDSKSFSLNEREMNGIGYQLLQSDKAEEAAKVFKLNIEAFPESSNVYDSYAEALMTLGQNEGAIENYKKSVSMDPSNTAAIEHLKKLGADVSEFEKEITITDTVLESYVGKYQLMPNFIITVTKVDKQMKAQATGQPQFDIFPKSENEFYLKVVKAQITFNKNEEGHIESLTLLQGGQKITGKRMVE
ncbi:serine hydrolase [Seonamhaeicola sp.]|uniref:serine hydrolase n=1 Tax=Seonamhaeicola sp. TaxID=1912245 RepID=UPI0026385165|nr:serine hydrolase [Seonamhaeicola sp.]